MKKLSSLLATIMICVMASPLVAFAADAEKYVPKMYASIWSLVPPVVAIALALITKEVYSSLFVGILVGGMFYSGFSFEGTITHIFQEGIVGVLSDSYNVGILIFLVILGTMVCLMNKAGGSTAFGEWASSHIKSRVGAQLATIVLGVLIFIDDYFNCLTVGSVMRPVTDAQNVSRAKLAYLIDATAAPVCIIAPISSWAAAVTGFVEGEDGFSIFIRAIPYNFYAILTIVMMIAMVMMKVEYGPMKLHEDNAKKGDIYTTPDRPYANAEEETVDNCKGKVMDLLIPIISLIICCVIGMIYTGGFFEGESFVKAFAGCDASLSLSMGSAAALLFTIIFYLVRRVLTFQDCMNAFPEGFKAMISPVLILTFAWTLSNMTSLLGAREYVSAIFAGSASHMTAMLPAIVFLVAIFLAFSTGTSWGTFGILLPIIAGINLPSELLVITVSACLAGAVCGDHCSPISDTTIMSSAGAQCDHMNHVTTQIPYVAVAATVSFIGYCIAGVVQNPVIVLAVSFVIMTAVLAGVKKFAK